MNNAHQRNILFVLEQADKQPVVRRVEVYRWVASICGDAQVAANINALADAMDATERLCREFEFDYANPKSRAVKPGLDGHGHDGAGKDGAQ